MPSAYVTMYHPWQRNKQRPGQVSSGWPAEIWRGPADALAAGHALAAGAVASSAGATQVQRKAERGNKRARARLEQSQWLGDAGAACDGLAWPGPARPSSRLCRPGGTLPHLGEEHAQEKEDHGGAKDHPAHSDVRRALVEELLVALWAAEARAEAASASARQRRRRACGSWRAASLLAGDGGKRGKRRRRKARDARVCVCKPVACLSLLPSPLPRPGSAPPSVARS